LVADQQLTFVSYLQLQYFIARMHPRTKGTYRACHRVRRSRVVARQRTPVKLMAVIQAGPCFGKVVLDHVPQPDQHVPVLDPDVL